MRELDIAVARALGLAQRLDEGVVADAVELSGYRLEADVGHVSPSVSVARTPLLAAAFGRVEAGVASHSRPRSTSSAPSSWSSRAGPTRPSLHGLDFAGRQSQLDVPFQLLADIEKHRIGQRLAAGRPSAEIARYCARSSARRCGGGTCPARCRRWPRSSRRRPAVNWPLPSRDCSSGSKMQPQADEFLTSTSPPNKPAMRSRRRDALFACGAMRPA